MESDKMCSPRRKWWKSEANTSPNNDLELNHRPFQSQQSQARTDAVIRVENGCKHYGTNTNPLLVLDGLNMTILKGTIYGLLGASGCGKTTLLNCILGQNRLDSGKVWVLGGPPGTKSSGVPGPRIGYMPQETALLGDLTIQETFIYFGWIAGLNNKQIQERAVRISKSFMLPDTNQRVKTLSGGEQRRVSFASCLLHEPELLILDEPTVGLDPILRVTIWNYLLHISKENNTTVVMTTHYIEEVRQAHIVGLMRGGKLLAEASPDKLLAEYETERMEDVFLKLCVSQNLIHQQSDIKENSGDFALVPTTASYNPDNCETSRETLSRTSSLPNSENFIIADEKSATAVTDHFPTIKFNRLKALIWKNTLWWKRNTGVLAMVLTLSVTQVVFSCLCVGTDPRDLSVAVVNYESNNTMNCNPLTCSSTDISCNYLEYFKKRSSITLTYHSSEDSIKESTFYGNTHASIVVPHNYTAALRARIDKWDASKPWDIEYSNIDVFMDFYNYQVTIYLKIRLYIAFQEFLKDYLEACNLNPRLSITPIKLENPIYGLQNPSATDDLFPGALLQTIFLLSILLTSSAIMVERNEASFGRTFAMGITTTELLISHVVCEFVITVVQSILAVVAAFTLFDLTHNGSTALVLLFSSLSGVLGMCYGILISCICDSLAAVTFLALGSCIPALVLSGTLWPIEGVHPLLKPMVMVLPLTRATESLKNVLQKNWDLYSESVYTGFFIIGMWSIAFLILSAVILHFKKR